MSFTIPTVKNNAHYTTSMLFGEETYILHFDWNDRENRWYFGLSTYEGTMLLAGRKILVGGFFAYKIPNGPQGFFIAVDSSGTNTEAGFDDLGARVQLGYFELEE